MYILHALINTFCSNIGIINTTNGSIAINNKTRCTTLSMTWSKLNTSHPHCNNYPYMGTICSDILTIWHLCTVGNGDIYVNETVRTQKQRESDLTELDTVLGL